MSFFSVGFRPFYLGAAVVAAVSIPVWAIAFLGGATAIGGITPFLWHTHEMIFGFAPAVIVGFLLTAVRNWTGLPTPSGPALGWLFGLWAAGRILGLTDAGLFGVVIDVSFLPVVAFTLGVPLWKAGNLRNAFVVVILLVLAAMNALFHAIERGWLEGLPAGAATTVALDVILILMVVIGGRIIPAFSSNAVATLRPRSWVTIEWLAIGLTVLIVVTDIVRAAGGRMLLLEEFQQVLLIVCATVHFIRLAGWQPWKTWRIPLLLVLPLAYLWIPVHLILRIDHPTLATHALTVGAMAGLMLAMMTRSALGHTGRALVARPVELLCFASIHLAALTRVVGPILLPEFYQAWIQTSALLWTLAFSVFALAYWPILTRPRIDQTTT